MIDKYWANLIYKPEAIHPIKRKLAEEGHPIGNWPYPIFGGSEWQWTGSSTAPNGYNYNTVISDKRRELIRLGKINDTANIIELCNVIYSIFIGLKYHPEISHISQMLTVCHAVSGPVV